MQLTVEDVARLFGVTEGQIHHWIEDAGLPVAIVNSRYRFNRTELEACGADFVFDDFSDVAAVVRALES